eukprot:84206-Pyramimonas_sp.AAC.1
MNLADAFGRVCLGGADSGDSARLAVAVPQVQQDAHAGAVCEGQVLFEEEDDGVHVPLQQGGDPELHDGPPARTRQDGHHHQQELARLHRRAQGQLPGQLRPGHHGQGGSHTIHARRPALVITSQVSTLSCKNRATGCRA